MGADIIVLGLSSITSGACFANLGRGAGGCLQPGPQGIVELTFSLSLSLSLSRLFGPYGFPSGRLCKLHSS